MFLRCRLPCFFSTGPLTGLDRTDVARAPCQNPGVSHLCPSSAVLSSQHHCFKAQSGVNSSPQACAASALPPEPSPQHLIFINFKMFRSGATVLVSTVTGDALRQSQSLSEVQEMLL